MFKFIKFYFSLILLSISFSIVRAQPILSNHSFSKNDNLIGTLTLPGQQVKFGLIGENAQLFRLQGNKLYIRKENIKADIQFYD